MPRSQELFMFALEFVILLFTIEVLPPVSIIVPMTGPEGTGPAEDDEHSFGGAPEEG